MKTIHHVVNVPVSGDQLFEAVTSEEGLSNWWSTKVSAPGPIQGGVVDFTFTGDFNPDMEITEVVESSLVEWKCVDGHEPWQDNTFSFEIEDKGDSSVLRFWQHYARELSDDAYGTYNYNWGYYLQSLYELVTTGQGKPFEA